MLKLEQVRQLAAKILDDQAHPEKGRRTLSVVDPEARKGKRHVWHEQTAHGNQIEQLSIDGAGFNGAMLRCLEAPDGFNIDVYTPPAAKPQSDLFPSSAFTLTEDGEAVICPAGETSHYSQVRDEGGSVLYRFKRVQCAGCPLLTQCKTTKLEGVYGRSVTKNTYEEEYERARAKSQTEAYAEVRQEHPAIERKLNEILNHHRGRRAHYWGKAKVKQQETMTCFAVNVKRILKLVLGGVCVGMN